MDQDSTFPRHFLRTGKGVVGLRWVKRRRGERQMQGSEQLACRTRAHSAKDFVSRRRKSFAEMQSTTIFVTPSVQKRKKQRKLIALQCHRTEEKRKD